MGTGNEREHISVFNCIAAEFDHNDGRYLLADGEWFRLKREFVQEVNDSIARIPVLEHQLPAWNHSDDDGKPEREDDWNTRACESWSEAALLDKSNISHGGGSSKIEPADILTKDGVFGHAKRRDKSSSGLSHLFAQGVVAAQLISQDQDFRRKVAQIVPDSHNPIASKLNGQFNPSDWTIGYILLGANGANPAGDLPFFSKVNLKGAAERLRMMRYQIGLIGV